MRGLLTHCPMPGSSLPLISIATQRDASSKSDSFIMEIVTASLLDLNALNKLEHACFEKDAWPFLDLLAVLTFAECGPFESR